MEKTIVIAGGGYAGIRAALDLESANLPNVKIVLVSDKTHHEYHAALYRVVTGKSPLEVCIPLSEVFENRKVEVVKDFIQDVDLEKNIIHGESGAKYKYDYLILSLGSQTSYFGIPGLDTNSFGFKSVNQALRLKKHLHDTFSHCEFVTKDEKICLVHVVIVGAGASGVEAAGELALYTKELAWKHHIDPSLITIDIIEASSRILPLLHEEFAKEIELRLRSLGVNIFLNRTVVREDIEELFTKDMELKTETVIWTAGIGPNTVYTKIKGLKFNEKKKVVVDEYLRADGYENVFVIGDGTATKYEGMAQTAIHHAGTTARNLTQLIRGKSPKPHKPRAPFYAIPAGPGWAGVIMGPLWIFGFAGWILRRVADMKYFLSILPVRKAILVFQSGRTICESCEICSFNES